MSNTIQFNDKALNDIAQSVAGKLKNFQTNLDNTSADIRSLEKWLQDCGVCFYAEVSFDSDSLVAWSHQGGAWRLTCSSPGNDSDRDEAGNEFWEYRPLIEMPVDVRLKARPYLSKLLTEIASLVPNDEVELEKKRAGGLFGKVQAKADARAKVTEPEDLDAIFNSKDEIPF